MTRTPRIAVVDYGAGNLASVVRGLQRAGADVAIATSPRELDAGDAIVVPGVGHFAATATLGQSWRDTISAHVDRGRPLLGICLGMQWLFEGSDEAPDVRGLGLFRGRCRRLPDDVKVPHVGWNTLDQIAGSRLLGAANSSRWMYFTHTFAIEDGAQAVVATASHGTRFAAVVERGSIFGTQYHPEKSGVDGLAQLRNFVDYVVDSQRAIPEVPAAAGTSQGQAKRLIACLDVRDGEVVKGTNFSDLRVAGDPPALARRYDAAGIDELVLLDVTATLDSRRALSSTVRDVARGLSIPFAVGGGIRSADDAKAVIEAGADKVCINTAALRDPLLIGALARVYGSQAVVVAIDAKREHDIWRVFSRAGTTADRRTARDWAREAAGGGAGEILLTSIDRDGTRAGFDCDLTRDVSEAVSIPVIASGGAGEKRHFLDVLTTGKADAALAASAFHFDNGDVAGLKDYLAGHGVPVARRSC